MLVILPPRSLDKNERETTVMGQQDEGTDFSDFSVENLLETLDFDDFFVGINDGDLLPSLEMNSENIPDFSVPIADKSPPPPLLIKKEKRVSKSSSSTSFQVKMKPVEAKSYTKEKRSTTLSSKSVNGKKKTKVDWTPELHRRFVQAVEQLGLEKAVPSRILELMGINCLTRHNVASHLQKYRSHRKHLLEREAEAANWNQRRQMNGASAVGGSDSRKKDRLSPWMITPPTIGFPPVPSVPPIRPLHVWGHPSVDQSYMRMCPPKRMSQPSVPPHAWLVPPQQPNSQPSGDTSLWIPHHNVPTPGTPCFTTHLPPPPAALQRFQAIPVTGIPPPPPAGTFGVPAIQTLPQPPSDIHPSTETADATIGDVLSKPWMPLPLGLKPPSVESVMVELCKQGISKIPTSFS